MIIELELWTEFQEILLERTSQFYASQSTRLFADAISADAFFSALKETEKMIGFEKRRVQSDSSNGFFPSHCSVGLMTRTREALIGNWICETVSRNPDYLLQYLEYAWDQSVEPYEHSHFSNLWKAMVYYTPVSCDGFNMFRRELFKFISVCFFSVRSYLI